MPRKASIYKVQTGGVYRLLPTQDRKALDVQTSLTKKALGHMVLVLGPYTGCPGYFRIMTVTTHFKDIDNFVPFYPLLKVDHPMQLRLVFPHEFPKYSYLRLAEEFWIEGVGLGEMVARVPMKDSRGMSRLLGILERRERESVAWEQAEQAEVESGEGWEEESQRVGEEKQEQEGLEVGKQQYEARLQKIEALVAELRVLGYMQR